jgi:hypothetical protein
LAVARQKICVGLNSSVEVFVVVRLMAVWWRILDIVQAYRALLGRARQGWEDNIKVYFK